MIYTSQASAAALDEVVAHVRLRDGNTDQRNMVNSCRSIGCRCCGRGVMGGDEAMGLTAAIVIPTSCLSAGADGINNCVGTAWGINGRVMATAVEEAVPFAAAIFVIPGNLPKDVDGGDNGESAAWRIDGRIVTTSFDEAMLLTASVDVVTSDQP